MKPPSELECCSSDALQVHLKRLGGCGGVCELPMMSRTAHPKLWLPVVVAELCALLHRGFQLPAGTSRRFGMLGPGLTNGHLRVSGVFPGQELGSPIVSAAAARVLP